jgi:hypothetical protein
VPQYSWVTFTLFSGTFEAALITERGHLASLNLCAEGTLWENVLYYCKFQEFKFFLRYAIYDFASYSIIGKKMKIMSTHSD